MNLMHEVLTHRYYPFYLSLPNNREMAMKLHELGYFNDENGQPTEVAQKFFDDLFEENKNILMKELRKLGGNPNKVTYNQLSTILDFPLDTFFLHHFLMKLHRGEEIVYREVDDFNSELKIIIRK